jgi:4,5-DOPA dioxygenase extradiol
MYLLVNKKHGPFSRNIEMPEMDMAKAMKENSLHDGKKMPALFIGHGSPMNVISDNEFTKSIAQLGRTLPRPVAIMVVSAHWLTDGTYVTCTRKPETIHDFYGFPEELYRIMYPSLGAPDMAKFVTELAAKAQVRCNSDWGLDHASWAVLRHMYPNADIPVFEMSLDHSFNDWHPKPLSYHYELALELMALRRMGVLIIGSGNIVHNLSLINFRQTNARPYSWAVEFDEYVKSNLLNWNPEALINYEESGRFASYAVPTLDHYLPIIYTVALREKDDPITFIYEGFQNGSISMRCFRIG